VAAPRLEVWRQADDALDKALADDPLADLLDIASEQHAMGHNDRDFAGTFDKVEKVGIVPVLLGRHAIVKAFEFIIHWVEAVAPSLIRKGRIGHDKVERLEPRATMSTKLPPFGTSIRAFGSPAYLSETYLPIFLVRVHQSKSLVE
jgi:hypothetical protein